MAQIPLIQPLPTHAHHGRQPAEQLRSLECAPACGNVAEPVRSCGSPTAHFTVQLLASASQFADPPKSALCSAHPESEFLHFWGCQNRPNLDRVHPGP
jgi:hypothetical protein